MIDIYISFIKGVGSVQVAVYLIHECGLYCVSVVLSRSMEYHEPGCCGVRRSRCSEVRIRPSVSVFPALEDQTSWGLG